MQSNVCAYCGADLTARMLRGMVMEYCGLSFCNSRCCDLYETRESLISLESEVVYADHPELVGDWMVAGDWHVPYHHTNWVMRLIEIADMHKIPNVLIAGDFINADEFSTFSNVERPETMQNELRAGQAVIELLLKHFSQIVWLPGNHETRIARFMNGRIELRDLFRMFTTSPKVIVSRYQYAVILGPDGETRGERCWRVSHPGNYRSRPTLVAQELADSYQQNVLVAHDHMVGAVASPKLGLVAGGLGMMADERRIFYKQFQDRIGPRWQNGFWAIRNGFGHMFWRFTDWELWLGKSTEVNDHAGALCVINRPE